jgi:hypothetical protein
MYFLVSSQHSQTNQSQYLTHVYWYFSAALSNAQFHIRFQQTIFYKILLLLSFSTYTLHITSLLPCLELYDFPIECRSLHPVSCCKSKTPVPRSFCTILKLFPTLCFTSVYSKFVNIDLLVLSRLKNLF